MQHYGVPTRLLDVTTDALVALYFACETDLKVDGEFFIFQVNIVKKFDSDVISILSSLPRFSIRDQNKIKGLSLTYKTELENIKTDDTRCFENIINRFNNENLIRKLLHEIKKEKPAFENIINPIDLLNFQFFMPRKNNARIIKQNGAFIIFGINEKEVAKCDSRIKSIIIDKSKKQDIIEDIFYLGINEATLHPELYKVAEYIKTKYESK